MNNNFKKNIAIWLGIFFLISFLFNILQGTYFEDGNRKLIFSEFISKIEAKEITEMKIKGRNVQGKLSDGTSFTTYLDFLTPSILDKMLESGAKIEALPIDTKLSSIINVILSWIPMLLLIGVWVFFMRQMNTGGGKAFGFGKSKAKLMSDKGPKITFADVAGVDEAKEEMTEIVEFLRDPIRFQKLGGKIPKGCLLIGPPGTGKTLLAKAIAGEANVPFFSISGSDFVEMFVGVGASRVRDMFEQGKKNAPCIIFIDEIDAVGRHRGIGLGGGNDEREQTLNQMLVEMDGFEANEGVVIIAATNRPDVLDPALLRPGRFDRQISIGNPDIKGREQILKVHINKIKHEDKLDIKVIAKGTPGFSGADLANLVNEAALLAARKGKKAVELQDLEHAKDKVLMGVERKSMVMTEQEKMLTAYHEGGHAIVALYSKASDPIHKATIVPRGRALGMVVRLPEKDNYSQTREQYKANIAVAMGGRVAEEIIFGYDKVTSGASSDIEMATKIARAMVSQFGLSDKLGPISYIGNRDYIGERTREFSESTAKIIDEEVHQIINEGYTTAKTILEHNIDGLHTLASKLLEEETLSGEQINELLDLAQKTEDKIEEEVVKKASTKKAAKDK